MKVAALFSGGKDSVFSIYIAKQWGWDISHLVTVYPENKDSWMFHSINIHVFCNLAASHNFTPTIKIRYLNTPYNTYPRNVYM